VAMRMQLILRFDYGRIVPWVNRLEDGTWRAVAGPDMVTLHTPVPVRGQELTTVADFEVSAGQTVPFVLTHGPSHLRPPREIEPEASLRHTEAFWTEWVDARRLPDGEWADAVIRSLITLKALTYAPTGGIVAAPTTSLPEQLGGLRNWDYRFCWLRDATFTLYALMINGYTEEATAWRNWLLRAVAGDPSQLHIMYGVHGERRLTELELPWLPGYEKSRPVRIGNAAVSQLQLDVYGEVMDALHLARRAGIPADDYAWSLQKALLAFLETAWSQADEGIWEVRGPRRHFTYSKVMAWVAFDRAIKAVERYGAEGPVDRWRQLRARVHDEVCRLGFDAKRNTFTQYYGSDELDASLLMIPLVGFLPASDPRAVGTVQAIERHLMWNGFVRRYETKEHIDGLPPSEGVFVACSFWLADNYELQGRHDDARRLFVRLLDVQNDLGLMSEEYDPDVPRHLGNFPQAFSHVMLINTARNLTRDHGPAEERKA
jgi:GH15 family glucan-1,4-alpha-glucosidase